MIKVVHAAIDAVEVARLQGGRLDRFAAELLRRLSVAASQDLYKAAATGRRLEELLAADEGLGRGIRRLWLALGKDSSPGYDAIRYLEELRRIGVYGVGSLPLDQLLEPGAVTVVNLAGLRAEVQDHLAFNILARIFNARLRYVRGVDGESYPYPVVIVVEEAHRFMPPKSQKQTRSRDVAATIASEGRKFGVFLVAITQRPSRIDPDVLSQLQGQIILRIVNPRDQEAIRDSSEQVSQDLLDNLPGLNTGEAVVVGPLAPSPLMIRLRDRVLDYSGGDLSLVEAWAGGREDLRLVEELRAEALEKAGQLLGEQPPDLAEAVAAIAGLDPAPETVERALRLLAREQVWASYSEETGTVYGEVMTGSGYSYEARVSLPERRSSCSCRARQPCSHAVAVLLRALLDGLLAVPRQQPSEPEGWWSELL